MGELQRVTTWSSGINRGNLVCGYCRDSWKSRAIILWIQSFLASRFEKSVCTFLSNLNCLFLQRIFTLIKKFPMKNLPLHICYTSFWEVIKIPCLQNLVEDFTFLMEFSFLLNPKKNSFFSSFQFYECSFYCCSPSMV